MPRCRPTKSASEFCYGNRSGVPEPRPQGAISTRRSAAELQMRSGSDCSPGLSTTHLGRFQVRCHYFVWINGGAGLPVAGKSWWTCNAFHSENCCKIFIQHVCPFPCRLIHQHNTLEGPRLPGPILGDSNHRV